VGDTIDIEDDKARIFNFLADEIGLPLSEWMDRFLSIILYNPQEKSVKDRVLLTNRVGAEDLIISAQKGILYQLSKENPSRSGEYQAILNQYQFPFSGFERKLPKRMVRRPDTPDELPKKLDEERSVTPIFDGELNREAMAEALAAAMDAKGLSLRTAATAAGTTKSVIQKILGKEASIDKGREVLAGLGYRTEVSITPE